ncbi:MAG: hypothetical protein ABI229_10035 [Gemmatimonadaceae bacterium]
MLTRRMAWLSGLALAAAGGMAACSKPATPSSDLSRDLDAASSASTLTLAPTSGRRDVISAVEQSPNMRRAAAPSRIQLVRHVTTIAPPPAQVATQAVAPPPATVVATVPAATMPATTPAIDQTSQSRRPMPVQQAHQGRYKTEAEVFRNAPFPITP